MPRTSATTSRTRRPSGVDAGVAGAILTSGFYDLGKEVSVWKVYYGDDVSKYAERSSLPGLVTTAVPLLVTDAELDPDMFQTETNKLVDARAAAGKACSACISTGTRTSRRRMPSAPAIARWRGRCSSSCGV